MENMPDQKGQYGHVINCYASPANLNGRTILAYHAEYSFAALRLDNEEVIAFAVEETCVGTWFEVFAICPYSLPPGFQPKWTTMEAPFPVAATKLLWREEWLEAARDTSGLLGAGPHCVQYVAPVGSAPKSQPNVVKVLAGLLLKAQGERTLVISSSDNAPFKVDLALDQAEIQRIMQFHTCGQAWPMA